eukprot:TRINITY_DN21962_c0_g1_i1.p1 TRINITY_DN21962_c0_g1~~TRINITY_DN21962_c0_g1_i1.p1  ORF type:complete len:153 (-),score=18.89 TRINITY_DN21962_c0_g1_i1:52-510(-)
MMFWAAIYGLAVLGLGLLIFFSVFSLVSFSDLESDYINPRDLVSRYNMFVIPEYAVQAVLTIVFLFGGSWIEFLFSAPVTAFHAYRVFQLKDYMLDATSIFSKTGDEKKKTFVKLAVYMILFFCNLYRLVYTLVQGTMENHPDTWQKIISST